jgi:hypothetical protein
VKERFIALGMNNNGLPLAFIPKDRIQMIVDELELKTEVKPVAIKPIAPVVIKEETVNQAEISVLLDKVKNGSYGSVHAATIAGDIGDKDWSKVVLQLARAMAYHSGKNVNLMYQALKSCKALLALRSDARYSHRWNNKEWLLELCNYACK